MGNGELDAEVNDTVVTARDIHVAAVIKAWNEPGPVPAYHFWHKKKLREEWPSLWKAVSDLAEN